MLSLYTHQATRYRTILTLFLLTLLCNHVAMSQDGSGVIRVDASDPRIVYLPTLQDGNWGISFFNDTDTEIRAYDENFTATFQYTGEHVV